MPSSTFSYASSDGAQITAYRWDPYLLDHTGDVDGVVLTGTAAIDVLAPALDLSQPDAGGHWIKRATFTLARRPTPPGPPRASRLLRRSYPLPE